MEVLEQPGGWTPTINVMAMSDQRHKSVSKQRMLLADVDVAPLWLLNAFHWEMNCNKTVSFI